MEYRIFNIVYSTSVLAYPVATVSERDEQSAVKRLEKHLIENDELEGNHLGFKAERVVDTRVSASFPIVLNSDVIGNRKGELDTP